MLGLPWGPLADPVADCLAQIPASFDTFSGITLHPAAAVLQSGERHEAVVFLRLPPDEGDWAEEEGRQGRCIQPEEVVEVAPSPCRLPAVLANRLYESGAATGREYHFQVTLASGAVARIACSHVVDFPDLPEGEVEDVVVLPPGEGEGRLCHSLPFRWCFYIWPRLPGDPEV